MHRALAYTLIPLSLGAATLGIVRGQSIRHPDDVPCDASAHPDTGLMEFVGDLASDRNMLAFYAYSYFKSLAVKMRAASCNVEVFFDRQDLSFDRGPAADIGTVETVTLAAVGDIMTHPDFGDVSTTHLLDEVHGPLFDADITFGNLETPVRVGRGHRSKPKFNMPVEEAMVYLPGFDVISTANNHSLDQGVTGLESTLEFLEQRPTREAPDALDIRTIGTSKNAQDQDRVVVVPGLGIRVAFLGYTFSTNDEWHPGSFFHGSHEPHQVNLVNLNTLDDDLDISMIERHIELARSEHDADVVVVSVHWGMENEFYPPARIIDVGHAIADAGADVILGHHTHILNPMERYVPNRADDRGVPEVLIAYSLGGFLPNHRATTRRRVSIILQLELSAGQVHGERQTWISAVNFVPTWFHEGTNEHRVLDLAQALANPAQTEARYGSDELERMQAGMGVIERFTPDSWR